MPPDNSPQSDSLTWTVPIERAPEQDSPDGDQAGSGTGHPAARAIRRPLGRIKARHLAIATAALPFVALAVWLPLGVSTATASSIAPTMVSVVVAVAVFAINFSFVAFQLAPYRQVLAGPSPRHVTAAGFVIAVALIPLVGFACSAATAGRFALAAIPLLAGGTLGLAVLALAEASPGRLLATRTSERAQSRFLRRFAATIAEQAENVRRLDPLETMPKTEPRTGIPMHELGHRLAPPPIAEDPVEACVVLAHAAAERDDAVVFVPAVERLVELGQTIRRRDDFTAPDGLDQLDLRAAFDRHVDAALARVEAAVEDEVKRAVLLDRFIEVIARTVREKAVDGTASDERTANLYFAAAAACQRQIERGTGGPATIGMLIAARQACELGSRQSNETLADYHLASYADAVQSLGEAAIDVDDAATLYRCLEALGWIGSSAVRNGESEVGRRAAGSLVQLGRRARHASLECHWDRCALTPYQHALERLGWLLSWVPKAEHPGRWLNAFETAFGRLVGQRVELELADETIKLNRTDQTHVEGQTGDGGTRYLDYSDFSMLKQQVLR